MAKTKAKPETWLQHNDRLLRIMKWCRDGYTNKQIADKIGISMTTFKRWTDKEVIPEETDLPYRQIDFKGLFGDFLIYAREQDEEVEAALKKQATGYWIEEQYMDKKGKPKTVRRWIPPSDKAQSMWLRNRRTEDWTKEDTKQTDTSALERLDAILGVLTLSAQEAASENEDNEVTADGNVTSA